MLVDGEKTVLPFFWARIIFRTGLLITLLAKSGTNLFAFRTKAKPIAMLHRYILGVMDR
jgi:hypothetical protein